MARPSTAGGKTSASKTRRGRRGDSAKTKRHVKLGGRSKRYTASELTEARAQQAVTAEILKVIARSPSDLQRVFNAILESIERLIDGDERVILLAGEDGMLRLGAAHSPRALHTIFPIPLESSASGLAIRERRLVAYANVLNDAAAPPAIKAVARRTKAVSVAIAPLLTETRAVGAITLTRSSPDPFSEKERALLSTFADQAVIAIENARLFNETQEALEQQRAIASILSVINRTGSDLSPVFDCILEHAHRLCGAPCGSLQLYEGGRVKPVAIRGMTPAWAKFLRDGYPITDAIRDGLMADHAVQTLDLAEVARGRPDEPSLRAAVELGGIRTMATVPLAKNGITFGRIVAARQEVRPFAEEQIALLQSFAAQAVSAIENARLFSEVQAKTRHLEEALEQQTATADVLQVINSSPGRLEPVFAAMLEKATHLCEAAFGILWLCDGEKFRAAALHGVPPAYAEIIRTPIRPLPTNPLGRMLRGERLIVSADVAEEEPYRAGDPVRRALVDLGGARSVIQVGLVTDETFLGSLTVYRNEVRPFSDKQIALLQNFAAQAVIAMQNARLLDELRQSLQQQTATADVLKVISRSAFDLQKVLDTLTESAARLCGADMGAIARRDERGFYHATNYNFGVDWVKVTDSYRLQPGRGSVIGRALLVNAAVQIPDVLADREYTYSDMQQAAGYRTLLGVPMHRLGEPIGVLFLGRKTVEPFTEKQIELVQTFADQAVIAIANVELFDEVQAKTRDLEESLQQQTATADVLKVISRSAFDLNSVLSTLVAAAAKLCEAERGLIFLREGDFFHTSANFGFSPELEAFARANPLPADGKSTTARAGASGTPVQAVDLLADETQGYLAREYQRIGGHRTNLGVPLRREGKTIGVFTLTRQVVKAFTPRQIELVQTFADQAVIAIENARLFGEVQARTRDLQESLRQQTATADVLKVISRSAFDLQPVFDVIAENAVSLCEAERSFIFRYNGQVLQAVAHCNAGLEVRQFVYANPIVPGRQSISARAALERRTIHVADVQADPDYHYALQDVSPIRTLLAVPMLKDDELVGVIASYRLELKPFSTDQIALLETFADQAVIAIENARLFNETKEALARQTATSDVLKVIASSPSNLQPVFASIAERSKALIGAHSTVVVRYIDGMMELAAFTPVNPEADALLQKVFPRPPTALDPQTEKVLRGEVTQILDAETELQDNEMQDAARARGWRSRLLVPLKDDTGVIGWISITRKEAGGFIDKDVDLLQTFADQAVIAIKNVELFEEVQARTRDLQASLQQQTATSEVLQVISSSQGELGPVFDKMLENAARVCGANFGTMNLWSESGYNHVAGYNVPPQLAALRQTTLPMQPHAESGHAAVVRTHRPAHFDDLSKSPAYFAGAKHVVEMVDLGGARSMLVVPLLKDDELIGAMAIYRQEVRPFTDKQIALVENFSKQAVIAIENARLLRELRQRTDDLSKSLDDLRTAQDRLIQTEKLASLGQLTAGIAHEIKNPLNFVNNFSALSVELTDELNDALKQAALAEQLRKEVDELTGLLKSNLEKVVQHGKRADSIVKNMLLHSREGSGELRAADINGLVEESLNLAYHGARAEKSGFNITLQRKFDANAGAAELFPQEITRALLNLISNGFYAATRRKAERGDVGFEPTLSATTTDLGTSVEIRIRDNGTGILPAVKEKIFNPFFTTKPAGEGTGLGLSMTHDIIVKQHGGTISVDTQPGEYTEFIVTLPRATSAQANQRSTG